MIEFHMVNLDQDIFNRTGSISNEKWTNITQLESCLEGSEEGSEHKLVSFLSTLNFNFMHMILQHFWVNS